MRGKKQKKFFFNLDKKVSVASFFVSPVAGDVRE